MSVQKSEPLPSPRSLKQELPATISQIDFVEQSRKVIVNIMKKNDPQRLLIVGPCSIHHMESALAYARKLQQLSEIVEETFYVVMRVYFEKPRTCIGWKGIMYDPFLNDSNDMNEGIRLTRMLLRQITDLGLPAAAEILDPISASYFGDLLSWGCIGARTCSSQIHRQAASGMPIPMAFKNNTDGNIQAAINGVISASQPHSYIGINETGSLALMHSTGNPHCHIVLRGGKEQTNYDSISIQKAAVALQKVNLPSGLIVDCSHDNSRGNHENQPPVFRSVVDQIIAGNDSIRGFILESHLQAGNQSMENPTSTISLTDPCMDWTTTSVLIQEAHEKLLSQSVLTL